MPTHCQMERYNGIGALIISKNRRGKRITEVPQIILYIPAKRRNHLGQVFKVKNDGFIMLLSKERFENTTESQRQCYQWPIPPYNKSAYY